MENLGQHSNLIIRYLNEVKSCTKVADTEKIRNIVEFLRKSSNEITELEDVKINEFIKIILEILVSGILSQSNQILLSTVLCLLAKQTLDLEACHKLLSECVCTDDLPFSFSLTGSLSCSTTANDVDFFRVCVSWSILQCFSVESLTNFYATSPDKVEYGQESPFNFVFSFLDENCRKFNSVTFLSFKSLALWLKRMEDLHFLHLVDDQYLFFYFKRALYIVTCNWENPVTGVREKNVEILKAVFNILPKTIPCKDLPNVLHLHSFLKTAILEIPWRMKCKYFILESLLPRVGVTEAFTKFPGIPCGLVYSLSYPHLVKAGADSYRQVIKEITKTQWLDHFYCLLKTVLAGKDRIAKENLMSYWMPETLKAFPSVITDLLSDLSCDINSFSLFPLMALYKIGRKNGLLKWEQLDHELMQKCLSHLTEEVRGEVFMTVCISANTTSCVTQDEINMVFIFLEENINLDNPRLRQVIVNSFKNFICRLKDTYCLINSGSISPASKGKEETVRILGFFQWLLKFISFNFVPGVNYQRRIGSLHLLRTVLDNASIAVMIKSKPKGQKSDAYIQIENSFKNEIDYMFKSSNIFYILLHCHMDSVADIRDTANAILKKHFELPSKELFPGLWQKALSLCKSSMFYEIESGSVLAECLIYWVLCPKNDSLDMERYSFMEILLSCAEEQFAKFQENVLKGAMNSPVHGILNVFYRVISSPDVLPFTDLEEVHVNRLMHLIDDLINFALEVLSSKPDSVIDVAPSFAEMGIAIEYAISENAKSLDDVEVGELTGAAELILNCIWLNLKVSCLLLSALATSLFKYHKSNNSLLKENGVEYCGQLLVKVLMKCRHKGAIESAGKALSVLSVYCVSSSSPRMKELPMKMLTECLEQSIGRRDVRTSTTRCSAGLSILVHSLVTANGKNAVPWSVPKLISWAEMDCFPELYNTETEDLPQTQALNFLKVIVQDSAAYQFVSPFMSEIALVCFKNFSSGIWAIRNAALQLFGAVVPKLVGQKKGQEEDLVGSNATIEELNAHYPALLKYLLEELKESVIKISHNSTVISPTLLPILTLCSRLTLGIPQLHTDSFKQLLIEFQFQFSQLLSNPNIAVRKSCAKAVSAFTPYTKVLTEIEHLISDMMEKWPVAENELHGKLLCIEILKSRLEVDSQLICERETTLEEMRRLIKSIRFSDRQLSRISHFTKALWCEIKGYTELNINSLVTSIKRTLPVSWYPGLSIWAAVIMESIVVTACENQLCPIMQECFLNGDFLLNASLQALTKRLKLSVLKDSTRYEILLHLFNVCKARGPISTMTHCLRSMLQLCSMSSVTLSEKEVNVLFITFIESSHYGIGCSALALSLISCLIVRTQVSKDTKIIAVKVVDAVHEQSLPSNQEEVRLQAARTLYFFLPLIHPDDERLENENTDKPVGEKVISALLHTAILLLQDENVDIRKEAARFVSNLNFETKDSTENESLFNPQKCIRLLFTHVWRLLSPNVGVMFLWSYLTYDVQILKSKCSKLHPIRNPFDQGIKNIFSEKVIITKYAGDSLKRTIRESNSKLQIIRSFLKCDWLKVLEEAATLQSIVAANQPGVEFRELADLYHTFICIKNQLEVVILLGAGNARDLQLVVSQLEFNKYYWLHGVANCNSIAIKL